MCGIAGLLHFDSNKRVDPSHLKRMCDLILHRGPDDEGYFTDQNFGMGMRRLSIIDIKRGHQPVSNEDNNIHVVFNGEIYNFLELRSTLEKQGHHFKANSDTEVIVHLYEKYGQDCVQYLRGMFAFALWDTKEQKLLLARDHIGKKPLFYRKDNNSFSFASELRSLYPKGDEPREINFEALSHYLSFQYVPSPLSIYKNVYKLPPAHTLTITKKGDIQLKKYWTISFIPKTPISFEAATQELDAIIQESTKLRLMSEVPLGSFLSGGIDSSLITAIMQKHSNAQVKTFTIGFDKSLYNEVPVAQKVATHLKTDHQSLYIKPDFIGSLEKIVWHHGEPFADPSALPTFFLCQEAKKQITVALCGDGGDENFAGYTRYAMNAIAQLVDHLPLFVTQKLMLGFLNVLPSDGLDRSAITGTKNFLKGLRNRRDIRNVHWGFFFNEQEKQKLFRPEFLNQIRTINSTETAIQWFNDIQSDNFLDKCLGHDLAHYLPDNILVKADISSMAHSLELRSPLLDYKVIEYVAQLHPQWKLKNGRTTKVILKQLASKYLPKEILRLRKRGFSPPISSWFREEYLSYLKDILLDPQTFSRGYFRQEGIEQLIKEHVSKKYDHGKKLWCLLTLELWHRTYWDQ